MGAQRPWEKSCPPGVRWDPAIETAILPFLFDAFPEKRAAKPALECCDRKTSYAELRAGVGQLASGLMNLCVGPGTSVVLLRD
jgi:long-chain acyl-CoA synthetase